MNAVETKGLTKHFGPVQALSGLDLAVPAGTLYALLGVNGAGKSTAIKILTGLLPPSGGEARILGYDVVRQREAVKRRISLCPQDTAVAPNLTAEENLILLAGLSGARRKEARARTEALLESLQLQPVARRRAKTLSGGKVALPVEGGIHALNAGEKITISGSTSYDGTHVLQEGTENGRLVITASFTEETFDGSAVAVPVFYRHAFALPKRQPTLTMEKYLDFETGAAEKPYRRFAFCKVNGLNFNFGGDDELKFSLDFVVGRESGAAEPLDASPLSPPAVPFDNIETSVWINGVRRGEVESGDLSNAFGIEAKAAVGDLGQYSRMPEGDPECKSTLTCFLESETFQQLSEDASTVSFAVGICAVTGDEVWFRYPETELDTEGAAINGKEGLMQTVTVMPFVDKGDAVMAVELVNRVESYA